MDHPNFSVGGARVGIPLPTPLLPPSNFPSNNADVNASAVAVASPAGTPNGAAQAQRNQRDGDVFFAEADEHINAITPSHTTANRSDDDGSACRFVRPASAFARSPPTYSSNVTSPVTPGGFYRSPPRSARVRPSSAMAMARAGSRSSYTNRAGPMMAVTGSGIFQTGNSPARDRCKIYSGPLGSTNRHEYNPDAVEIKLSQERRRRQRAPNQSKTPRLEETRLLTPTASSASKMRSGGHFTPTTASTPLRRSMPPSTGRRNILNEPKGAFMGTATARFMHDTLSRKQYTNVTLFEPPKQYDVGKIIAEDFATPRAATRTYPRPARRIDPAVRAPAAVGGDPVVPDPSSSQFGSHNDRFNRSSGWNPAMEEKQRRDLRSDARQQRVRDSTRLVAGIVARNDEVYEQKDKSILKSHAEQAQGYQEAVELMRKNMPTVK